MEKHKNRIKVEKSSCDQSSCGDIMLTSAVSEADFGLAVLTLRGGALGAPPTPGMRWW